MYSKRYQQFIERHPDYLGIEKYCNICGFRFSKFAPAGIIKRAAQCPVCGSLERHRHLYFHIFNIIFKLEDKKIIHFAPEPVFKNLFLHSKAEYYDVDILPGITQYTQDITRLTFSDNYFDFLIACHVFEHVENDIRGFNEIFRVLKVGGIALLSAPLSKIFYEDLSITDPDMRLKHFGKEDHVRWYNEEIFHQRIKDAGFSTETSRVSLFPQYMRDECLLGDLIIIARKESLKKEKG